MYAILLLMTLTWHHASSYSALEDSLIIAKLKQDINHARIARTLVHQADWASVGTISTNNEVRGYPMVNIISIDDNDDRGASTGKIRFLLTDLDFTGPDWRHSNNVTFLFTDAQTEDCEKRGLDPMEPTCPRVMLSGKVIELNKKSATYKDALIAFTKRHPAAINWIKAHTFYLCELKIQNIFMLDYYGRPHNVRAELYYDTEPKEIIQPELKHAKVARTLVHQANWASVGTISTNDKIMGFPMVNIISIDDNDVRGVSTGKIRFMLTDLDFTGPDWRHLNKVTFLFTDEQNLDCKNKGLDPMEPTCPRVIFSGEVIELNTTNAMYPDALAAFMKRHPAAQNWTKAHSFYLCELKIQNIFVLDYYGGPHNVPAELYYNTEPNESIIPKPKQDINHAKVARGLVHQADWASVGTISTNAKIRGYPMVNIISIDDSDMRGTSTGKIRFMLEDSDFTGADWRHSNKVTFLFTDEQNQDCRYHNMDPMEPTCPRAMLTGKVIEMDRKSAEYDDALNAFIKRHPAAVKWLKSRDFYLCELDIENIFVLDYYGGPHNVPAELYYNTQPNEIVIN